MMKVGFHFSVALSLLLIFAFGFMGCSSDSGDDSTGPTISAPENLTVEPREDNSVLLSWAYTDQVAQGFRIYRSVTGDDNYEMIAEVPVSVTDYIDEDLSEGASFSYRVKSYNVRAESPYSNTASVVIPPDAPTNLSVTGTTATEINLSWIENSDVEEGIKIERSLERSSGYEVLGELAADASTFTDDQIESNITYFYRVYAWMGDHQSGYSNVISATTISAPQNLAATALADDRIQLTWEDENPLEYGFTVQRTPVGLENWSTIAQLIQETEYTDDNLSEGFTFTYRVKSTGNNLQSPYSNEATATTLPAAPGGLEVEQDNHNYFRLTWRDYSRIEDGFEIQRSLTMDSGFQTIATVGENTRVFSDDSVEPDVIYYYRLRATAEGNHSLWSGVASVTTTAPPANLVATVLSDTSAQLDWEDVSQVETGYHIHFAIGENGNLSQISELGANTTSFTHRVLEEGQTYRYAVSCFTETAISSTSNEVVVRTLPSKPSRFTATRSSAELILLTWKDESEHEDGFEIQRSLSADSGFEQLTMIMANDTAHVDTGLTANTTYYYRLRAVKGGQYTPWTQVASATTTIYTPNPPSDLNATDIERYAVTLNWTDNSDDENAFGIEYLEEPGGRWRAYTIVREQDLTSYTVTRLNSNWQYSFRVYCSNDSGRSVSSEAVEVHTLLGPPADPTNLRGEVPDHQTVNLYWQDNAWDEDGYIIERREYEPGQNYDWVLIDTVRANFERATDNTVEQRLRYQYHIAAYNAEGTSAWSNVIMAQIPSAPIVSPEDLTAEPRGFEEIYLMWNDIPNNENGYLIERRPAGEEEFEMIDELGSNEDWYLDEDLERGAEYDYRVKAWLDRDGGRIYSEYTNVASAATYQDLNAPENLNAIAMGMSSIGIYWDGVGFEDGFIVERRMEGDENFNEIEAPADTFFVDTGLDQETTYEYQVKGYVEYEGETIVSEYSDIASAQTFGEIAFQDDFEDDDLDSPPDDEAYNITAEGESTALVTAEAAHESNKGLHIDDADGAGNFVQVFVEHQQVFNGRLSFWLKMSNEGYFGVLGADPGDFITFQIQFNNDNTYLARDGANLINGGDAYPTEEWFRLSIEYDVPNQSYDIYFDDELVNEGLGLQQANAVNAKFLVIGYNGDGGIETQTDIDDFEVRRIDPEDGVLRNWIPGNTRSGTAAVSIQDVLRAGPLR